MKETLKKTGTTLRNADKPIGLIFALLSLGFIVTAIVSPDFFNWIFKRHHNQLSWYIRPLFLIPFCFFAFKRSFSGISITLFALCTSMFWFNAPEISTPEVKEFLAMEMEYLTGNWTASKIALTLMIPLSLTLLAGAFWKRSLKAGLMVVVLMAAGKIIWSIVEGGQSGLSVLIPAITGLAVCMGAIYAGFTWFERKRRGAKKRTSSIHTAE